MVAGAALILAACGGGKKDAGAADTTTPPAAPAGGMAAGGTVHEIQMVTEGANTFKFVPENTVIKAGDQVVFKGVSGIAHDVAFVEDSIPPGAKAVLTAAVTGGPQDMATTMINDGQSATVSFAGAPAGVYHFYCIPHMAMNMRGSITVQ
jgi:plastocyanin